MKLFSLKHFNRLFWKIFVSLWLSSAVVMLVTMLVIAELAERDNYQEKVKYQVRTDIEKLLNYYESNPEIKALLARKQRRELKKRDWRRLQEEEQLSFFHHHKKRPPVRIYDERGQLIMGSAKAQRKGSFAFSVKTHSDKKYRVEINLKHATTSYSRWQGFIFSLQALLILMSSTLASFVISAIVVRPINQLRKNVVSLHSGDFSQRTAKRLQRRGDEIGDFARELNQMAEQVEKTLVGQQNLFQNVSHELRAPLARLMAASGIIEQQVGGDHPAVQRVQIECERLTLLIDELLSLAKLDQQKHSNRPQNLALLLEKVVSDSKFIAASGQQITLRYLDDVGSVIGASSLLERVFGNIVHNALKYAGPTATVDISVSIPQEGSVLVTICDNGPGVPEAALEQLCDPFFRLDINIEGHGLGLGIAKQALQMQGGHLRLSNHVPHGLCVEVELKGTSKNL